MKTFMEGIISKFKGLSKASKVGLIGIVVVGCILALPTEKDLADKVKDGTFYSHPDQAIGETFDTAFGPEGEWTSYNETGKVVYQVQFNGHNLVINFTFDEEGEEFNMTNIYVDGYDYSYDVNNFIALVFSDPVTFRDRMNANYSNEYYYYN